MAGGMARPSFDSVENQLADDAINQQEEIKEAGWYYYSNGRRVRYHYCDNCPYKTYALARLRTHTEKFCNKPLNAVHHSFECFYCDYNTSSPSCFKSHKLHHQQKFPNQCHLCTYSTVTPNRLTFHINMHHRKTPVVANDDSHQKKV